MSSPTHRVSRRGHGQALRIQLANPDDREAVLSLLGHWELRQPVEARYTWIYENNPLGPALTWVAEDPSSGQLVGCNSCFPRRLLVRGRVLQGAVGGDTFVHPDWRRRGVAKAMHEVIREDLSRVGLTFHLGFADLPNRKALTSAGSAEFESFGRLALPLSTKRLRFAPAAIRGRILRWRESLRGDAAAHDLEELSPDGRRGCKAENSRFSG